MKVGTLPMQTGVEIDREFRRIAAEVTEHTILKHTAEMVALGFGSKQSFEMCMKLIKAKKELA